MSVRPESETRFLPLPKGPLEEALGSVFNAAARRGRATMTRRVKAAQASITRPTDVSAVSAAEAKRERRRQRNLQVAGGSR